MSTEFMTCILVCVAITLISTTIVVYTIRKTDKTLKSLSGMLDQAMNGQFKEQHFDESMVSSLEAKLARYLSATEGNKNRVQEQKAAIESLIADISHQTKTPIANLLLFSDLLKEQDLDEQSEKYSDFISGQTRKLEFLIRELIKSSRLENGIIHISTKKENIVPMLEEIYSQMCIKAEQKGISIQFEHEQKAVEAVFDRKWTTEAISNILDNAVKYTDEGGKISIRVIPYEMFVGIEIEDNGIGIKEVEQAQVFQRFYRSARVQGHEGVGLGLYLAREIVTKEGGYIKLYSKESQGSKFVIFLQR